MITHIELTPTLSTSAYSSGDVLFVPLSLGKALPSVGSTALLVFLALIDVDAEGVEIDLLFFSSAPSSLGALNAAEALNDADAKKVISLITIAAADYKSLVGSKRAEKQNLLIPLFSDGTSKEVYVAGVVRGTPTFAAATDIKLVLGFSY